MTEDLRKKLGLKGVSVLEKGDGFPICSSKLPYDDVVLMGTIIRIWLSIFRLAKDLDFPKLKNLSIDCEDGFIFIDEFAANYLLLLIGQDINMLTKLNIKDSIEEFRDELSKALRL
ncbi:MAG: hypothetical protein GF364_17820 [Candidatus Lokiarchaeota archaeon]|nr:hypothetical protein [Candidatus Lokiarchaeota archaeon]